MQEFRRVECVLRMVTKKVISLCGKDRVHPRSVSPGYMPMVKGKTQRRRPLRQRTDVY